jgi:hypothetical protein
MGEVVLCLLDEPAFDAAAKYFGEPQSPAKGRSTFVGAILRMVVTLVWEGSFSCRDD